MKWLSLLILIGCSAQPQPKETDTIIEKTEQINKTLDSIIYQMEQDTIKIINQTN